MVALANWYRYILDMLVGCGYFFGVAALTYKIGKRYNLRSPWNPTAGAFRFQSPVKVTVLLGWISLWFGQFELGIGLFAITAWLIATHEGKRNQLIAQLTNDLVPPPQPAAKMATSLT